MGYSHQWPLVIIAGLRRRFEGFAQGCYGWWRFALVARQELHGWWRPELGPMPVPMPELNDGIKLLLTGDLLV